MACVFFKQVRRLDPEARIDQIADLYWDSDTGELTDPRDQPDRQIEGEGRLIVGPTFCDLYAHSGEPGYEERESLATLAAAALAGGYGRIGLLPAGSPVDDPTQVDFLRKHFPDIGVEPLIIGAISRGATGEALSEAGYLAEAGVVAFSDDRPIANWLLLRRFFEYAQVLEKPVMVWPCLPALATGLALEGAWAFRLGLSGRPVQAETVALSGLLELVRLSGAPLHLMRISTARGVELVAQAKAEGLPVTASTTIHHLSHATPDLAGYDPCLRFDPPLGNPEDRLALVTGLQSGVLDAVASDHTPWTYAEKTLPFAQAPAGAIALELTLPLLWKHVRAGTLDALQAWAALSHRPERILGLPPQLRRSLVLFDPDKSWTVSPQTLRSRSHATAWLTKVLEGKVLEVFV